MSINLDEAMEEYARLPFEPRGAHLVPRGVERLSKKNKSIQ